MGEEIERDSKGCQSVLHVLSALYTSAGSNGLRTDSAFSVPNRCRRFHCAGWDIRKLPVPGCHSSTVVFASAFASLAQNLPWLRPPVFRKKHFPAM